MVTMKDLLPSAPRSTEKMLQAQDWQLWLYVALAVLSKPSELLHCARVPLMQHV